MSTVNHLAREVSAKIVFYGPGLSGKTTTLRKIYESVRPAQRGDMMSLATEGDRTLFFDFLPVRVERVGDCAVRLALYTVPGQVFYNATRKLVLQGADGVVFVADSQPAAMDNNIESFRNLVENLADHGIRLDRFPVVFQWNKRDVPGALSVPELRAALDTKGAPDFETCAPSGRGVIDMLRAITRSVIKDLRTKRVVLPRRGSPGMAELGTANGGQSAGLEEQLQQHIRSYDEPVPTGNAGPEGASPWSHPAASPEIVLETAPESEPSRTPAASASVVMAPPGPIQLGPASALAPSALLDYARAADVAFAAGDHPGCVHACLEAVRHALAFAGDGSLETQAFLLGLAGPDILKLQGLQSKEPIRVDDAAFSLYVLMQAFVRLAAAGLPASE